MAGAFTSQEHYMVLADYEVIDGVGYFLVADPYIMPERYSSRDQLKDVPGDNEGLIYATSGRPSRWAVSPLPRCASITTRRVSHGGS